jgi:UDP-N-acetylglucosamine 2-epimerase (non-hydrolysing)
VVVKAVVVAGARPNFVKIAPLVRAMRACPATTPVLVHTGQHYDRPMSQAFFDELEIPAPDVNLDVGSGSHAVQTAEVMKRIEPVLARTAPDVVVVVGDVNSTLAATLTAVKMGLPVAHVEAGLRSFDRSMPEEINRLLTDAVSELLFTTEESAAENLRREGIAAHRIHFVGNVMIDALHATRARWERSPIFPTLGLDPARPYAVLTLHRPSNVDDPRRRAALFEALAEVGRRLPILFPVHPRLRARLPPGAARPGAGVPASGIVYLDPLGYLDFVALTSRARLVLTDSGGIQEETTILGVPCLTLRESTERPVTVTQGTNQVIGTDPRRIVAVATEVLEHPPAPKPAPPLWDGRAAARIVDVLAGRDGGRCLGDCAP